MNQHFLSVTIPNSASVPPLDPNEVYAAILSFLAILIGYASLYWSSLL